MLVTLALPKDAVRTGIRLTAIGLVYAIEKIVIGSIKKITTNIRYIVNSRVKESLIDLQTKEPDIEFLVKIIETDPFEFDLTIKKAIAEREMELQYILTGNEKYNQEVHKVPKMNKMYDAKLHIDKVITLWDKMNVSYSDMSQIDRILKNIKYIKKVYKRSDDDELKSRLEKNAKSIFDIINIILKYKNLQSESFKAIIEEYNRLTKK